jgi:hypothetical protein
MWASYMEIPIDDLEVIVEADYNASGLYAVDDSVPARWSAIRYTVRLESSAPEEKLRELAAHAERYSSLLNAFRDPIPVTGELQITNSVKG